jgi:hypothetical protein
MHSALIISYYIVARIKYNAFLDTTFLFQEFFGINFRGKIRTIGTKSLLWGNTVYFRESSSPDHLVDFVAHVEVLGDAKFLEMLGK